MSDTNTSKKQSQNLPKKQPQNISSSPSPSPTNVLEEPTEKQTPPQTSPLCIITSASSPFDAQTPKRPRYTEWKPLPHQHVSSSDTASSGGGNELEREAQALALLKKGKFVSPVWKPNEMLWLARAWKAQY